MPLYSGIYFDIDNVAKSGIAENTIGVAVCPRPCHSREKKIVGDCHPQTTIPMFNYADVGALSESDIGSMRTSSTCGLTVFQIRNVAFFESWPTARTGSPYRFPMWRRE